MQARKELFRRVIKRIMRITGEELQSTVRAYLQENRNGENTGTGFQQRRNSTQVPLMPSGREATGRMPVEKAEEKQ